MGKSQLLYQKAAENWMEALPLGNGSLGAMVYGGTEEEIVALNEETFWAGYRRDTNNPQAGNYLPQVRKLVFGGEYVKAQDIIEHKMLSDFTQPYQPLGTMHLHFMQDGKRQCKESSNYSRQLHMNQGMLYVNYEQEDVCFQREYFCSYPDQLMAISISANQQKVINCTVRLDNVCPFNCFPMGSDTMGMETSAPSEVRVGDVYNFLKNNVITYDKSKETIRGYLAVKAVSGDGEVLSTEEGLQIKGSSKVILYLAAATTFEDEHAVETCRERILRGAEKGYDSLKAIHTADFCRLFDRMDLEINQKENNQEENNQIEGNAEHLTELLFQYGRYLMISGSREGCLPTNLQGIWSDKAVPPWWSNWTMNINLQMNYWPVYRCNLMECAQPYHNFIQKVSEKGRRTAEEHYGIKGWTSHHMMDIWMNTAPVGYNDKPEKDSASWAGWNMSAPWLCLDLWEYYHYTKDRDYLRDFIFPIMEGCAEFLMGWLQFEHDFYRTAPSTSPENIFLLNDRNRCAVCESSAMDMELIGEFFEALARTCGILKIETKHTAHYRDILKKLAPVQVGKNGHILEWNQEFAEEDSGHRHFSMLYSLYPGHGFTGAKNPKLYRAAEVSLKRRLDNGGGSTGWSRVWAICLWSRLKQGQQAYDSVLKFLKEDIFSNLFGCHPPDFFQIDCNFGFTAAIAEMLVQEENGEILPLPAIPQEWKQGCVKGLVTEGGNQLDIHWHNHKPEEMVLYAAFDGISRIRAQADIQVVSQRQVIPYERHGDAISIIQEKGKEYHILWV